MLFSLARRILSYKMQRLLNPDIAYAWINMQRQVDRHLFLLVEGDDEDTILYGHLLREQISVLVLGGKPNVLATGHLLASQPVAGVYSMIDRDLDDLTGKTANYPPNLVATRGYDLVSDVVTSRPDIFERALRVHGVDAFENVEQITGAKLTDICSSMCLKLAALRLVNEVENLGLNLRDFPFSQVINGDFSSKGYSAYIMAANARSPISVDIPAVETLVREAALRINGDVRFCGGHDLVGAAAAILRHGGAKSAGAGALAASLITATDCETLRQLPVKEAIRNWADSHSRNVFHCAWATIN
ncbi:DUF4435 domain-containing protein (plasmid) [Arthrobacter sp. D3-18]